MGARKTEDNERMRKETTEKIVNAALKVFAEYGFHGASMKKIASLTGLSYGIVYHYFPSKVSIFTHLVDNALSGSLSSMEYAFSITGSAREKIIKLSTILAENAFTETSAPFFIIILQAMTQAKGIPGFSKHLQKRIDLYFEALLPVIRDGQSSGDVVPGNPEVLAGVYLSLVYGFALLKFQGKNLEKNLEPMMLSRVLLTNH